MGKNKCFKLCNCDCFKCFRATFRPNEELQMLPKPNEADALDGVPFIDAKDDTNILIVRNVDPCIETNGLTQHTWKYELMARERDPQLVVRRGQSFKLDIALSRPYNEAKDGVSFVFVVDGEEKPSYGKGTLVAVPLLKRADRTLSWNVVLDTVSECQISVLVTPAFDCAVAKWRMDIDTKIIDDGAYRYSWETGIYILYNPWCRLDQVYMRSEEWREECTLNEVGLIWRGTSNRLRPCVWKYDQFAKDVLECSLYLIRVIGKVQNAAMGDPVRTTRALAAAVNSADDMGAVMGNWSEDFGGGTPPTKWLGSKEILQKYYKKKKPVKYGQCWVFSGVLTTVCRAVGIPSRTVTNYASAHDTQSSLTVDYFMDENGKIMEELNSDTIWNFHVWNEVWMQRPDLGKEYGGWQAIDATPQELSGDMFRCGPTSVAAVKSGEVLRPYDSSFLFAEVNADKVYWRYAGPTQPLKLLRKDVQSVGKLISTKAAGTFEREDITANYKHAEKSTEERETMLRALKQSENMFSRYYLNEDFNDIHFHFELRDDIKIGQPFDVSLLMNNRSKIKDHRIKVVLRIEVVNYTGKVGEAVKKEDFDVTVKAESAYEIKLAVTYEDYKKRLIDQCAFNVSCLAKVEETKFEYYAQDDFRVRKPDVKFVLQGKPKENQELTVDIFLENPLPVPLKKGEFTVDGPGFEKALKIKLGATVPVGGKALAQIKFAPPKYGRQTLVGKFVSKELDDCDGFLVFMVESGKEENNGNNRL